MTTTKCLVCLGSNYAKSANIAFAVQEISRLFPDVIFGETIETEPQGSVSISETYFNKALIIETDLSAEALKVCFKKIEKTCGRTPELKNRGIIPLDIDLLVYGNEIIKPVDITLPYVRQSIASLPSFIPSRGPLVLGDICPSQKE